MPPKHTVRYLPVAERDLLSIHDWIATDSPSRALTFVDKLDARIGRLQIHLYLGRIPRHPKLCDYRVLVIDSYLVFYKLRGRAVEIHRVVHGSRYLDDLL